ncbi:unnamed protein product, partial [Adineta steineri]
MIGRDNPKVNKSIEKLFDEELKKSWWRIVQMDPCHIYAAYNALKSGKKLVQQHHTDSCSWFRNSPARKEDSIKNIDELNEKSDPTYHLLSQELSDLYHTVLLSFLTLEYIGNKQGSKLLLIDPKLAERLLNDKQMRI